MVIIRLCRWDFVFEFCYLVQLLKGTYTTALAAVAARRFFGLVLERAPSLNFSTTRAADKGPLRCQLVEILI